MKILVAGATGNTGTRLVQELCNRGHEPVALVRSSSDTSQLPEAAEQRLGDLTDLDDSVAHDCEVVIFAAGSGGDTDAEMTDKVDRDGAIRLIEIAEKSDVRRFVMLSSVGAENPDPDSELAHYLEAKHAADERLKSSSIEYAILRPVALTDDDATGSVRLGDDVDPQGKAARGDVAVVLANAAEDDAWNGKVSLMETIS
ncbi:SDR family oxidoreductase [Qipengyuania psychrotolerans]|uniref:SDR family oxidoreductase n=1 Tax=Qipengyuania psychrotolerans TaxID=2867238 RepID=A0ABX8ZBS7_9SPHN|nr:SDR family oxidoreductase [Qipengyuania psychrotolerans]QZD86442.1 SDR family oxidoreductase [Qipengyuania psychrotolerans]